MAYTIDADGAEARALVGLRGLVSARVVEIGCGDGRLTRVYAASAQSVLAIDADPERIRSARDALPGDLSGRVCFRCLDATALCVPAGTFDTVLFGHSL
jgi:2-polyprenyl-3-methyl-5-hydroxy-6-metoxy-1,4-benzoquinol methylase